MAQTVEIRNVKFTDAAKDYGYNADDCEQSAPDRKRNLTMKYGQEQRKIVQRRLKVERWLDEELNKLYGITVCYYSLCI